MKTSDALKAFLVEETERQQKREPAARDESGRFTAHDDGEARGAYLANVFADKRDRTAHPLLARLYPAPLRNNDPLTGYQPSTSWIPQ